jgi:hypothetical protein
MICPICGANEARAVTIDGQVCYQQRDGHPCYVVLSLEAYLLVQKKLALLETLKQRFTAVQIDATAVNERRVLVDARAEYGVRLTRAEALASADRTLARAEEERAEARLADSEIGPD